MKKYTLEIVVFVCGAVVMILELVGTRVMAPLVGTSTFVWTSIIGIILGSLSLGYWWGGKKADQKPSRSTLSMIILLAGIAIGLINFLSSILAPLYQSQMDLRITSFIYAVVLFIIPTFLLGMVSPYAARLKIQNVSQTGSTVGNLYALSTLGSITGTFLAGFFLIAYVGSIRIIFLLALVLVLLSWLYHPTKKLGLAVLIALVLIIVASFKFTYYLDEQRRQLGFVDIDTSYERIQVSESVDPETGRRQRNLRTDPYGIQSAMFLDGPELVAEYSKYYRLIGHFNPQIKRTLLIGGAGFSFPKDYLSKFPNAEMDVVEIDPKMVEIARQYFELKTDPRLSIYSEDGRVFLNKTGNRYDAILIDAFKGLSAPFQLASREAIQKMFDRLHDNGVVITNIVSPVSGPKSILLASEYATYKAVFPQVYLFRVHLELTDDQSQNVIIVAIKGSTPPSFANPNPELNKFLSHRFNIAEDYQQILTDDFAPTDYYAAKIVAR